MSDEPSIICPRCGAAMNHHADKLYKSDDLDGDGSDTDNGGVVLEIHTCPECGEIQTRQAA